MVLRLTSLFALLVLSLQSYSQEAEWLSGELHLVNGSLKKGQVKIPQPTKSIRIGANKVAFRANKDAKTTRFKDHEIAFVYLTSRTDGTVKYVNIIVDKKLALFREVETIGDLTIYARSMQVNHASTVGVWFSSNFNEIYVQREGEKQASELVSATRGLNYFRKNVNAYFSNCNSVVMASEPIEKKEDVLSALQYYKNCI
ncbi:hypothetical protein ACFPH8_05880 [Bizionia hallyeonensis]|uniref:DUF4369 domain-containing protein n=1 Tax=Bizionia hallyeonensis TaxID=1123757 RepID=A0ABW0C3T3_9FLAO